MQTISKTYGQYLWYGLGGLLAAKIVWLLLGFFLPVLPPFAATSLENEAFPRVRHLSGKFFAGSNRDMHTMPSVSLKNIRITGIYKSGDSGFVIIDEGGKSKFLDLHQRYKGYLLIKLDKHRVYFRKKGTVYEVTLAGYKKEVEE